MNTETFFTSPNRFTAGGPGANGDLVQLANGENESRGPLVLPWDDGRRGVRWYVAVAKGDLEQANEELLAHVGVTYTDFRGQRTDLDPDDPGDRSIMDLELSRSVIRIDLIDTGASNAVAKAFLRYLNLWDIRPIRSISPDRAVGEVLRDYRLALKAGIRDDAESAVDEFDLLEASKS